MEILQITNFRFGANVFASRVWKVNFNELSLQIQILRVKSSEERYYLDLEIEKIVCSKSEKGKDIIHKIKMFIHIEYSLQVEVHCYYNGVQDIMLQIDIRAVFINNLLASHKDVS